MSGATERMLENILEHEHDLSRSVRFLVRCQALPLIEEYMTKLIEKRVYELSDGIRSVMDIEKAIKKAVTHRTILNWWWKWRRLGLVEQSPVYKGRMRHLISLAELGINTKEES